DGIRDRNVTGVQTCALPILVVALWVIRRQTHVFVQIERGHPSEVELLLFVQSHQLLIQAQWRGSGGHPEHGIWFGVEHFSDNPRSEERRVGKECRSRGGVDQ